MIATAVGRLPTGIVASRRRERRSATLTESPSRLTTSSLSRSGSRAIRYGPRPTGSPPISTFRAVSNTTTRFWFAFRTNSRFGMASGTEATTPGPTFRRRTTCPVATESTDMTADPGLATYARSALGLGSTEMWEGPGSTATLVRGRFENASMEVTLFDPRLTTSTRVERESTPRDTGEIPTGTGASALKRVESRTETLLRAEFAMYSRSPRADIAKSWARAPTSMFRVWTTRCVFTSITVMVSPPPFNTKARRVLGSTTIPRGACPAWIVDTTLSRDLSSTETVPDSSFVTYATTARTSVSLPSKENAGARKASRSIARSTSHVTNNEAAEPASTSTDTSNVNP